MNKESSEKRDKNTYSEDSNNYKNRNHFNDKYDFYQNIIENRNHILVDNAVHSMFGIIHSVDSLTSTQAKEMKEMELIIKKHLPDIVTFFEC
ncbi:hypothetical protein [Dysgonomonas macrotermitis]|uniref:Uncharacterized protein n=1 Tax=Dysgonomonas macrotermitis TaxID=1346286 RepID=A0A1M5G4Y1_9BACT|nr:hypothetical protein [Dysgonomonas macrotermitis]SHF98880.1 hypothetical protein SAMN05444362_11358 [Dysgonomonas macrotermitis]